jgi:hypothetical protein
MSGKFRLLLLLAKYSSAAAPLKWNPCNQRLAVSGAMPSGLGWLVQ